MEKKPPKTKASHGQEDRKERLKVALKSNLARRKAQARVRASASDGKGKRD